MQMRSAITGAHNSPTWEALNVNVHGDGSHGRPEVEQLAQRVGSCGFMKRHGSSTLQQRPHPDAVNSEPVGEIPRICQCSGQPHNSDRCVRLAGNIPHSGDDHLNTPPRSTP